MDEALLVDGCLGVAEYIARSWTIRCRHYFYLRSSQYICSTMYSRRHVYTTHRHTRRPHSDMNASLLVVCACCAASNIIKLHARRKATRVVSLSSCEEGRDGNAQFLPTQAARAHLRQEHPQVPSGMHGCIR